MGIHYWAVERVQQDLEGAGKAGYDPVLSLRALLSAVVQQSVACRDLEDLARELRFLADNLDDDRDYGFMRP
ncbi:MAG: hypothetical protein ABWY06_24005 [Pseudomonas sp.]|uniref:hypothetical protein n=1 Tax=Pseudomonas sp. TaxID=306 RepID=UPI003390EDAB